MDLGNHPGTCCRTICTCWFSPSMTRLLVSMWPSLRIYGGPISWILHRSLVSSHILVLMRFDLNPELLFPNLSAVVMPQLLEPDPELISSQRIQFWRPEIQSYLLKSWTFLLCHPWFLCYGVIFKDLIHSDMDFAIA